MKLLFILLTVVLRLGVAALQGDHARTYEEVLRELESRLNKTLAELEEQNEQILPGSALDIANEVAWQVSGSLGKYISSSSTAAELLSTSNYTISEENGKAWVKNFGAIALSFVPKTGGIGALPGFITILRTIAITMERAHFPELVASREAEERCFRTKGRTYADLCNNCKPYLALSLLGKLNGCSQNQVVRRDGYIDYERARGFCSDAVLCSSYSQGGGYDIIKQSHRYDPLRAFWCLDRDDQVGMLLSHWIGRALSENLDILDYNEFRKKLEPSCKWLLKDKVQNKCPTKDELEKTNKEFPPYTYCRPGKLPSKQRLREQKYEKDPKDPNMFVVSETRMQYRKEGKSAAVWTGKCGTYLESSDRRLTNRCCGPFKFEGGVYAFVKPEDDERLCSVAAEGSKVPEDLRKIKLTDKF